ncbi:MAG: hypothetical protein ACRDSK_09510 [Actinophytocola sp.]|uniref:hypothetical protein n=1 Tax=Actinophytocola sp. TaxID=1872138 RepID=UPI003D6A962C
MRGRLTVTTALPLVAVVLALSAPPAVAQPVTTPVPTPNDPNSPPMSAPVGPAPTAHAVGDSGTGLGIIRILPNSAPTRAIAPGAEDKLPKQAAAELGFGLATAQANSESFLAFERAVAEAAPGGVAIQGASPQAPGALAQTAPPNNPQPTTSGLELPSTPLDALITARGLSGQVHAQWDDQLGPCVDTISDASTEVGSFSAVNAIPTLPDVADLSGVLDSPKLTARQDKAVIDGLKQLAGPLSTLGGVLSGDSNPKADGTGSLLSLPNTLSARSTVRLVDIEGSKNKAVQSTSTLQVAKLRLLAGTPFAIEIRVVSQPTLQVTSTGDPDSSTVEYTAPVLEVWQGGKRLGGLDAANPKLDVPIGLPLPDVAGAKDMPIIGNLLANGRPFTDALRKLDLGVLRIGVAQLDERGAEMTDPFKGYQLGATARMLDLQVLPTSALGLPNLPSALAQVSLGEQVARAYAPTGGVVCAPPSDNPSPPPTPEPQGMKPPPGLAYTTMAYKTIPMFWTGTAMLLVGVVLVAALPNTARRPRVYAPVGGVRPIGLPPDRAAKDDRELSAAVEDDREPATAKDRELSTTADSAPAAAKDRELSATEDDRELVAEAGSTPAEATEGVDAESATAEVDSEPVAAASPESEASPEPTEADATGEEKPQSGPATERRLPLMPKKRPKN